MKKKFKFFLIIIFFFFNISSILFAESSSRCNLFYKDLENNFIDYKLDEATSYTYNDFGFILESKFNHQKDKWQWLTDEDGYYVIGGIISPDLVDKVKALDVIISVNDEDLRSGKINRDEEKYIEDLFEEDEEAIFKLYRINKKRRKKFFSM